MSKDYQFLIGQRFSVDGVTYVVRDLTAADDEQRYLAAGSPESDHGTREPARAATDARTFTLQDVINSLVVDEEIELFNPNYLAAR